MAGLSCWGLNTWILVTKEYIGLKKGTSHYLSWETHPLAISQFFDAKIRLRNKAKLGTIGGVCAALHETGIIVGGESELALLSAGRVERAILAAERVKGPNWRWGE